MSSPRLFRGAVTLWSPHTSLSTSQLRVLKVGLGPTRSTKNMANAISHNALRVLSIRGNHTHLLTNSCLRPERRAPRFRKNTLIWSVVQILKSVPSGGLAKSTEGLSWQLTDDTTTFKNRQRYHLKLKLTISQLQGETSSVVSTQKC